MMRVIDNRLATALYRRLLENCVFVDDDDERLVTKALGHDYAVEKISADNRETQAIKDFLVEQLRIDLFLSAEDMPDSVLLIPKKYKGDRNVDLVFWSFLDSEVDRPGTVHDRTIEITASYTVVEGPV